MVGQTSNSAQPISRQRLLQQSETLLKMVFSVWSVPKLCKESSDRELVHCVGAGLHTLIVALQVVGDNEKGNQCLGL